MISLYNLLGEKVTDIVDKEFSIGSHEIEFNAANLSTGVYFYRMEASSFIQIKKMVIMK